MVSGAVAGLVGVLWTLRYSSARADNGAGPRTRRGRGRPAGRRLDLRRQGQPARRPRRRGAARRSAERAAPGGRLRAGAEHRHGHAARALRPAPQPRHRRARQLAAPSASASPPPDKEIRHASFPPGSGRHRGLTPRPRRSPRCGGTTKDSTADTGGGRPAGASADPNAAAQDGPEDRLPAQAAEQPVLRRRDQRRRGGGRRAQGRVQAGRPERRQRLVPGSLHQHADPAAAGRHRGRGQRPERGLPVAQPGPRPRRSRSSRSTRTPPRTAGTRSSTRPPPRASARSLAKMASEQAGGEGEIAILSATPNATNQNAWIAVHEDRAGQAGVREAQARQDRVRQRRRPEVVPGGPGPAAVVPEPEGHRLADHRGHRRGRALRLARRTTRARSRSPGSACRTRCASTSRTAP